MSIVEQDAPIEERLTPGSRLHQEILTKLLTRRDASSSHIGSRQDQWRSTNNKMRMYIDLTRKAKKADGSTDNNTREMPFDRAIVVPASYSILRVLLTQLMSIFGSREPMIQIRGRGPEDVEPAKILESVLGYDLEEMAAFGSVYALCQDSLKFGCGIMYDSWHSSYGMRYVTQEMPGPLPGMPPIPIRTKEFGIIKEHNIWTPINPFNFYPDPRIPISTPQDGEFIGHRTNRGHMYLVERSMANGGPYFNIEKLRDFSGGLGRDDDDGTDLGVGGFVENQIDEHDRGIYQLDHLQVKLIPKEWGLGEETNPQIWWFTWADDQIIIRAHPCPYDHQQFTYSVAESDPDFHSAFNPGIIESLDGLQRYIDWLYNSHLQNLMRHLNDAMIFGPSFIEEVDVANPGPARHMRLTQLAEELIMQGGFSAESFIHQLPLQDVTSPHLNAVANLFQLAQRMSAANDPQMGMPTPDKRTLGEIQVINASASQRITIVARMIDSMAISPTAKRSISNRLQFTSMEQYYRIVGDDSALSNSQHILGNPDNIQGNYDYVPTDGILPPDPVRQASTWMQIGESVMRYVPMMMQMGFQPPDGMVPDVNAILKEGFKTMGARNIDRFYVPLPAPPQVMPDEQVEQQVQAGNMVPMDEYGNPM
jgi:hypothetical protein